MILKGDHYHVVERGEDVCFSFTKEHLKRRSINEFQNEFLDILTQIVSKKLFIEDNSIINNKSWLTQISNIKKPLSEQIKKEKKSKDFIKE